MKRVVGQSNELIQKIIYKDLDANDLKVFKTVISKINYNNTLFDDFYQIDYNELDMVGIKKLNRFKTVTKCLEKLSSTFVDIVDKEGVPTRLGLIQNKFKFPKNSSIVTVSVDEDLKPYLMDLTTQYTKYSLQYLGAFKNVAVIKFYEILRSFVEYGTYQTTVINLRKTLEIEDGKYPSYGNFKQKIITPYLSQINKTTDIDIEIEEIKGFANKTTSLKFMIKFKEDAKPKLANDLSEFIDKVFVDNSGVKFITKKFIPDPDIQGNYNLLMVNLTTYKETSFPESLPRDQLYSLIKSKIKE